MGTGISAPPISSDSPESAAPAGAVATVRAAAILPWIATAVAFAVLFAKPIYLLARDWWTMPEAGHGLLLAPVAIWMAWRSVRNFASR